LRVLYVSKALVVGAYQRKAEELAALPGVELHVAVPPAWRDERGTLPLERAHVRGYRLWRLPILFNGSFHFHFYPGLGRLLDRLRPDLLHMDEEPYNVATWHAARLAAGRRIPFVFFTWQNLHRRYPLPFRRVERYVYAHAAHAIAGNAGAARVLRAKGYAGPVSVIPQFGVDPALFAPAPAARQGDEFTVGYAGRLVEEKGLFVLLEAVAGLGGTWRLHIRGSGPLAPALRRRVEALGLSGRVVLAPPLPSTQMPDFYRALDVLVLPSLSRPHWIEQFGRVLIEAMACRVAVVGSDCGEIPHVIGEAGLVVPEGDPHALRAALHTLMVEPERRRALAEAGRERVLRHYTQAQIATRTWHVYRRVLGEGAAGPRDAVPAAVALRDNELTVPAPR